MNSSNHGLTFTRLGSIRFKISSAFSKKPLLFSTALLIVGSALGAMLNNGVAWKVESDRAKAKDAVLSSLSIELGRLRARADRLDSLGRQWVDRAGLEEARFDFDSEPARGGSEEEGSSFMPPNTQMIEDDVLALKQRYGLLEDQLRILEHWDNTVVAIPEGVPHASPGGGHQTSGFGERHDPFGRGKGFHAGIDFAANRGDPVMAMASGKVVYSGWQRGYGKVVEIDHGLGYRTRYAHNSSLVAKVGQTVRVGEKIAKAGSTGRSTGVHLHIEVLVNGRQVNPQPFLERGHRLAAEQQKLLERLSGLEESMDRIETHS